MGLHFLGRGRHWQISQLWASVRKPKGQSKVQPRLRPEHSSSPAETGREREGLMNRETLPYLPLVFRSSSTDVNTILYYTTLHYTIPYYAITILYYYYCYTTLYYTITILHYTLLLYHYYTTLYSTITIQYYTILLLYYIITILHYTILLLYYTILWH